MTRSETRVMISSRLARSLLLVFVLIFRCGSCLGSPHHKRVRDGEGSHPPAPLGGPGLPPNGGSVPPPGVQMRPAQRPRPNPPSAEGGQEARGGGGARDRDGRGAPPSSQRPQTQPHSSNDVDLLMSSRRPRNLGLIHRPQPNTKSHREPLSGQASSSGTSSR